MVSDAHRKVGELINGYRVTQIVGVAAHLGIADLLAGGPKTASELATETGSHERSLYRVLRALAGYGLLDEIEGDKFALTEMGSTLRSDRPDSWLQMALLASGDFFWKPWGQLLHGVKTGELPSAQGLGMAVREFFDQNPEVRRTFDDGQTSNTVTTTQNIVDAYDFSGASKVVDLGGGQGELLAAVLSKNAHLQGVLIDLPNVVEGARAQLIEDPDLAKRVEILGIDAFEAPLPTADTYMMKAVIHGLGDDRGTVLLTRIKDALQPGGRVLIIETVIPDFGDASPLMHFDLNMMVMSGGVQRTVAEYRDLLSSVGYRLERVIETGAPQSIVEAVPD